MSTSKSGYKFKAGGGKKKKKKSNKSASHHFVTSAVEGVSVPEAPLVAADEADVAALVLEVGFPHQGTVAEDPQAALTG